LFFRKPEHRVEIFSFLYQSENAIFVRTGAGCVPRRPFVQQEDETAKTPPGHDRRYRQRRLTGPKGGETTQEPDKKGTTSASAGVVFKKKMPLVFRFSYSWFCFAE